MGRFQYKAMTRGGDVLEQTVDAPSRDAVVARIRDLDQWPIDIVEADATGRAAIPAKRGLLARLTQSDGRPRPIDIAVFARQLGTLLEARVPLPEALRVVIETGPADALAPTARALHLKVREGASLSQAMDGESAVFDPFFRSLVRAGEGGGTLGDSLVRLAGYLEKAARLKDEVRSALIYPTILLSVALVSVAILIAVVLPQFETLLAGVPGELPWSTRVIFAAAQFLRHEAAMLALAGLGVAFLFRKRLFGGETKRALDRALLRLPVARQLLLTIEFERIFRSLAALAGSGVGLTESLGLAAAVARNGAVAAAVTEAARRVRQGERLSAALAGHRIVPPMAVQMVRIGEESGELGPMFQRLADAYAGQVETDLKRAVMLIEPALIVFIGVLVATIVLSLLSAIVGINAIFT